MSLPDSPQQPEPIAERRVWTPDAEMRVAAVGSDGKGGRRVDGVAMTYGTVTDFPDFTEVVAPGAFTRSIESGENIRALFHHTDTHHLASTQAGSLRLHDDAIRLAFDFDAVNTTSGNDALELIRTEEVKGVSVCFVPEDDPMEWDDATQRVKRTLLRALLVEITATPSPQYRGTDIQARSRGLAERSPRARALALIAEHAAPEKRKRAARLRQHLLDMHAANH